MARLDDKSSDDEEDGILKGQHHPPPPKTSYSSRKYIFGTAGLMVCATIVAIVTLVFVPPSERSEGSSFRSESSCTLADCSLKVISLMKNGKKHTCKEFCSQQLEWKKTDKAVTLDTTPLYGSFQQHGVCKEHSELGFKTQEEEEKDETTPPELIARSSSDTAIPDYSFLLESMQGKTILLVGDTMMRPNVEILKMWFPETKMEASAYIYNASLPDGVEPIAHCDLNFKERVQTCRQGTGDRFPCNCTVVMSATIADHTTIQYANGYGIGYENDKKEPQAYGWKFNTVQPALYKKLAETASAVVVSMGVIGHEVNHDADGYASFIEYIKQWSSEVHSKIVFSLTPPQHFSTMNPPSTYQDEDMKPGGCVEVAVRHWTNVLAQKLLHGSTVDLMDNFPYLSHHGLFHSLHGGDCVNWCLGHDVFYSFWKVLTEAIA